MEKRNDKEINNPIIDSSAPIKEPRLIHIENRSKKTQKTKEQNEQHVQTKRKDKRRQKETRDQRQCSPTSGSLF